MKRVLQHQSVVVLGGQIVQLGIAFVTGVLIARSLGPSEYGIFSLLRTLLTVAMMLAPLGLDASLLKYCGRADLNDPAMQRVVTLLRCLAGVLNMLAVVLVGWLLAEPIEQHFFSYPGFDTLLTETALALPLLADTAIMGAVFRARGAAGMFALLTVYLQAAVRLVLVVVAALTTPTLQVFVWINVLQVVATVSAIFIYERRQAGGPSVVSAITDLSTWRAAGGVLSESFWMALSLLVYGAMRHIDILSLGAWASAKDLGEYAALSTISLLVQVFPFATSQSLGPRVSKAHHAGDHAGVRAALDDYLHLAAIVSSFIFAGVAAFGERLDLVFGAKFEFSPLVCLIMPLGFLLSGTLGPTGFALSMTGRHREEFYLLAVGCAVMALLCWLLVPPFGQLGAATSVAVAFALTDVLRLLLVSKTLGFVPGHIADLLPIVLALALAFLSRHLADGLGERTFLVTFAGCVLYSSLYAVVSFAFLLGPERRADVRAALEGKPLAQRGQ